MGASGTAGVHVGNEAAVLEGINEGAKAAGFDVLECRRGEQANATGR